MSARSSSARVSDVLAGLARECAEQRRVVGRKRAADAGRELQRAAQLREIAGPRGLQRHAREDPLEVADELRRTQSRFTVGTCVPPTVPPTEAISASSAW